MGTFQEMLHFVPNADTNPQDKHDILEPVLFRFLLNEKTIEDQAKIMQAMLDTLSGIDKLSKITEIEIHKSSMGWVTDLVNAFHVFIVFKTTSVKDGDYWWSLEKGRKYIALQRSRDKIDVKDKRNGEERKRVQPIAVNLTGKGSIKDLLTILWAYQAISERYNLVNSNCQSLVKLVSNKITETQYEFKEFFEFIPLLKRYVNKFLPHEENPKIDILDLVNILSMCFERKGHPLFNLIYQEKPDLFDIVMESGKYGINDIFTDHRITTLHLAIVISSPEMVRHLLEKWKADPTQRDRKGRTALHLAALYAQENIEQIIDLLLEHIKVDELDLYNRRTALHYAICACNSIAVGHLIDKGADLDIYDNDYLLPLHLAACHEKGTEIVDLILKANQSKQNNEGIDDSLIGFGITALHMAVAASNEITVEYLIEKGANINNRDKYGRTPLHLAAAFARDMKIIKLLLKNIRKEDVEKQYKNDENIFDYANKNKNGLEQETIARLKRKGITGKKKNPTFSFMDDESNKKSEETVTSNDKTGITLA
jgi:ankyrin repeat protein